jgi:hypothetical protein
VLIASDNFGRRGAVFAVSKAHVHSGRSEQLHDGTPDSSASTGYQSHTTVQSGVDKIRAAHPEIQ